MTVTTTYYFSLFTSFCKQGTRLGAAIEQAQSGEVFDAPEEMGHAVMKFVQGFMGKGK